jgi:NAD(P)-dependent dehydrogenase (short-subunit alcohol dehydrogenase family)
MLLEQKTAVIYGAGGAIGGAVARAFAREGARVYLAGRTRPPSTRSLARLPRRVLWPRRRPLTRTTRGRSKST